jgi:hypothetical protein
MNSFFELSQDNLKHVTVTKGPNFYFPAHFHQKIEIFVLTKGKYKVNRNGKTILLTAGDIVVFDSYDIHSYDLKCGDVDGLVIIIPPNTAEKFFKRKNGKKINNPLISDSYLCNKIFELGKNLLPNKTLKKPLETARLNLFLPYLNLNLI